MDRRKSLISGVVGSSISVNSTPNNVIYYTSSINSVISPYDRNVFGANIVSNTYKNGSGIITFDGDVTTIGTKAFYNKEYLASIIIPYSVTKIGTSAFYYCIKLTNVIIHDSVTTIGDRAFEMCYGLTSVTIPDSITEIGNYTFQSCTGLTSVTIPDSVTEIGSGAFKSCKSLTSVTIPDSVTTIGSSAFQYCTSLTSVYCKATIPPSIGNGLFSSTASTKKIYVPIASVNRYKSATYWSDYANDIVGYNF